MADIERSYPAKILLFGEYTILLGSSALGIPYDNFSAYLSFWDQDHNCLAGQNESSNKQLHGFYKYLLGLPDMFCNIISLERFKEELGEGIYLHSTIPAGYGLGSSGALVASVFERYAKNDVLPGPSDDPEYLMRLKKILSVMESCFHGKSSGFDPLIILLRNQMILKPGGIPETTILPDSFKNSGAGMFLLNTGHACKTSSLVHDFLERYKPDGKITPEGLELSGLVNTIVEAFINYPAGDFWKIMEELSLKQLNQFYPMIPRDLIPLWKTGLNRDLFYMKLCGSGGGGFLTVFAKDASKAIEYLQKKTVFPVLSI